jgi:mannose-1-phosphate guanylyltransferase
MIPALVLTAGLATRLRPLSLVRAKAALPVAGTPLVCRILGQLAGAGVTDAVLNLHHLPHTITGAIGDGAEAGIRVRYSWEDPVLGSAGGPRRALPLLGGSSSSSSTFLLVNGDTLTDVDLAAVVAAHRKAGALVTIAVVPNSEPEKYGGAIVDDRGVVTGFVRRGSTERSFHVIGVQVAEAEAFALVPENVPYESVLTLYPQLTAARPDAIHAFQCTAEFFDIGTPSDYLATSLLLASREQNTTVPPGARIEPSAIVERSILWDDVVVEAGAMLRECVVTDRVRVPADTSWHGVSLRVATDDLAPGEKRIGDLAIAGI